MTTATMREIGLISLADISTGADSKPRSWVMLLPQGSFDHHTYGKIDLSKRVLDELVRNFNDKVRGIELALDYDHKAAEGDSRAPGWIEAVEYRAALGDVPAGLWAKVRWTSIGLDDVRDERYRYISAEFKPTYKDELSGRSYKNVLIGATLTNRPFMKQMPAIALSQRKFQKPGQYNAADRKKIAAEDFAGPHRSFPIITQQDVHDAARLIGHADNPAAVKARITAIAKRKGFSLPAEWEDDTTTAASETAQAGSRHMALDERDQFDPEDATDDAEAEDFEETEADESEEDDGAEDDGSSEDEVSFADRSNGGKGKSKASDDDNDAADEPDADEDDAGEALDDSMDSEDYAEEDEEDDMPAPKAKGKRMMAGSQKMSEAEAQAEIVRLSEALSAKDVKLREYETRDRVSKLGKALKFAESAVEEESGEKPSEDRMALSRTLRQKYAKFLGSTKLSEGQLDQVADLLETAIKLGVVDLTSRANNLSEAYDDLDTRREQKPKKGEGPEVAAMRFAEEIARRDHQKSWSALPYEQQEAVLAEAWSKVNR